MQSAWYDYKTHKKLLNMNVLSKIIESIGPAGLVGLDKLYSHMIKSELEALLASLQKNVFHEKAIADTFAAFDADVKPLASTVVQPSKLYAAYTSKLLKIWPKILLFILSIGQKQIIRKHIANELNSSCKFNSKNLDSSLRTINELVGLSTMNELNLILSFFRFQRTDSRFEGAHVGTHKTVPKHDSTWRSE